VSCEGIDLRGLQFMGEGVGSMSSCEETETKQEHTATTVQCGAREGGRRLYWRQRREGTMI
jgi:hypothetical protein